MIKKRELNRLIKEIIDLCDENLVAEIKDTALLIQKHINCKKRNF